MTEPTIEPIGFIVACKEFFGFAPNQTLLQFKDEVSQRTPADREELAPLLSKALGKPVSV